MTNIRDGILSIYEEPQGERLVYLQIRAGAGVIAFNGHVDLGTGIETALAQIVAEELDLPLDMVRVVLGDTALTPDQGPTIASETIQITAVPLRLAAAQARHFLLGRAARRLNAPEDGVQLIQGQVHWKDTSVGLLEMVEGLDLAMRLDRDVPLKPPSDYRIVGTPVGRRDLPQKVTGEFAYIHDLRIDGMLHGHVIRPP